MRSFELGPLDFLQVFGRLLDQHVEQLQEGGVGLLHDFLVVLGVGQSLGGVPRPDHLNTKQTHLQQGTKSDMDPRVPRLQL